jgi:hypothetical protein
MKRELWVILFEAVCKQLSITVEVHRCFRVKASLLPSFFTDRFFA